MRTLLPVVERFAGFGQRRTSVLRVLDAASVKSRHRAEHERIRPTSPRRAAAARRRASARRRSAPSRSRRTRACAASSCRRHPAHLHLGDRQQRRPRRRAAPASPPGHSTSSPSARKKTPNDVSSRPTAYFRCDSGSRASGRCTTTPIASTINDRHAGAHQRRRDVAAGGERGHDQHHLEPFQRHALERHHARRPVGAAGRRRAAAPPSPRAPRGTPSASPTARGARPAAARPCAATPGRTAAARRRPRLQQLERQRREQHRADQRGDDGQHQDRGHRADHRIAPAPRDADGEHDRQSPPAAPARRPAPPPRLSEPKPSRPRILPDRMARDWYDLFLLDHGPPAPDAGGARARGGPPRLLPAPAREHAQDARGAHRGGPGDAVRGRPRRAHLGAARGGADLRRRRRADDRPGRRGARTRGRGGHAGRRRGAHRPAGGDCWPSWPAPATTRSTCGPTRP